MALTAIMIGPLRGKPISYSSIDPTLGDINIYNTSSQGPLTMTLPQLASGIQTAGANMLVEKDPNDTAGTAVTFNCYAGDTFVDGSTSLVLTEPGEQRTLEVVNISGFFYWKIIGGLGGGTSTSQINSEDQFGENPDDVSQTSIAGQDVSETTRFGEHLPTGTGYGGYGDGLYGYGY